MTDLHCLAELIRRRNATDREIAARIGRPALPGHTGEYIAAAIFGIELAESAVNRGSDGCFIAGPIAGRTVNVKWYTAFCGLLDIRPDALPDYFLVLAGPRIAAGTSRNTVLPWAIESVYLFDSASLIRTLQDRGVKIGTATSIRRHVWDAAEIYPRPQNPLVSLIPQQRDALGLFSYANLTGDPVP